MSLVKALDLKTGMRTLVMWAMHKGFWTLFNVLFTQSAEDLTPRILKEKFTEVVVFHLIFKLVSLHSPENPNSLLGKETAKKLAKLTNPELLPDIIAGIDWPSWDIEQISQTKPSGIVFERGD